MDYDFLEKKSATELLAMAEGMGVETARLPKDQLAFNILKKHSETGGDIFGSGVLEVLPDGFGFLRSPKKNYLPSYTDIYVQNNIIRRLNLRNGDTLSGKIRPPKPCRRAASNTVSPDST